MDLDLLKRLLDTEYVRNGVSLLARVDFSFTSVSKASRAVTDKASAIFRMLSQRSEYIAGRVKEAQDPRVLRCWSRDEVSEDHREFGILHGYRSENCSVLQAILSLFHATNETVNFWTHFLPSLYFAWLFSSLSSSMPLFSDEYLFPFVVYMTFSCAYPLMSSLAHAFSCLSPTASHVCFFMDYAAISLYSWGAAILYYHYAFPQVMVASLYASLFLPVAALMALLATFMACYSRVISSDSAGNKMIRISAFVVPYLWVSLPLLWRLYHCGPEEEQNLHYTTGANDALGPPDSCSKSGVHYRRQFVGVLLASFFYGSHIPERFAPGRFDLAGNSHNLLHLFGIAATYEQLRGALVDMRARRAVLWAGQGAESGAWLRVGSPVVVLANVAIILAFTNALAARSNKCNSDNNRSNNNNNNDNNSNNSSNSSNNSDNSNTNYHNSNTSDNNINNNNNRSDNNYCNRSNSNNEHQGNNSNNNNTFHKQK